MCTCCVLKFSEYTNFFRMVTGKCVGCVPCVLEVILNVMCVRARALRFTFEYIRYICYTSPLYVRGVNPMYSVIFSTHSVHFSHLLQLESGKAAHGAGIFDAFPVEHAIAVLSQRLP